MQENPCDPPPPCLDAMEQAFGFTLSTERKSIELLTVPDKTQAINAFITVSPTAINQQYRVEFIRPSQLFWLDQNTFRAYLQQEGAAPREIILTTQKVKVNCCPQWQVHKIELDGKPLCENCETGVVKIE